jgi:hypothetical protein
MRKCTQLVICLAAIVAGAQMGSVKVYSETRALPGRMNLQGYLTDAAGSPISGVKSFVFKLYRDGGLRWQEAQDCTLQVGLFSVLLGAVVPIDPGVFDPPGTTCELDINVEGQPLTPRVTVSSNAFAFRSQKSDSALYFPRPIAPQIAASEIADSAVTMPKIARAGAQVGQVIRWNGSAWAPASVSINSDSFIKNQDASIQHANFRIDGGGEAQQFYGATATASIPGILGDGGTYSAGVHGEAQTTTWGGAEGFNLHSSGTGVIGVGNDAGGVVLTQGSGGSFSGTGCGVLGYSTDPSSPPTMGAYFLAAGPPDNYAYIAAWDDQGYGYRCLGNGDCAQGFDTKDGIKAVFSVQAPGPSIEDRGHGRLMNGSARIDLAPEFLDCVTVTDRQPLDVFVQLNGDCQGVYVVADARGFDVRELKGGTGNVEFTWRAVAAARDKAGVRFPRAPGQRTLQAIDGRAGRLNR